jgi:hypothetical protein
LPGCELGWWTHVESSQTLVRLQIPGKAPNSSVGKGRKAAQESPVAVFEDARGPNVRVLRQAQRRLAPAELEALIAEYEAGGRVGELAKVYGLHRTTRQAPCPCGQDPAGHDRGAD